MAGSTQTVELPNARRRRIWSRAGTTGRPPRERGDRRRSFLLTLIAVLVLAAFLSPLLQSFTVAIKTLRADRRSPARRSGRPTR